MGRIIGSIAVGLLVLLQLGVLGMPGSTLRDPGAPDEAVVYFKSAEDGTEFIVYPDQIELAGNSVVGGEVVIPLSDVLKVRTTAARLTVNTRQGQIWVQLGVFGSKRAEKAAG